MSENMPPGADPNRLTLPRGMALRWRATAPMNHRIGKPSAVAIVAGDACKLDDSQALPRTDAAVARAYPVALASCAAPRKTPWRDDAGTEARPVRADPEPTLTFTPLSPEPANDLSVSQADGNLIATRQCSYVPTEWSRLLRMKSIIKRDASQKSCE